LMMKLHAQYMFVCILCWFCSNWYKLVLLLLIVINSCLNEVVELDILLLLICTMGIPFCEVVVWIGEVCVKLFMWRTKMNFWYVKFLTEFLVLLGELDLVKFLFSCCGWVSRVVWEKTGVLCEKSIVNRFEEWVFMWGSGKLFWDIWNLNFLVDYDITKCQERVGENGIENGLTVWILRTKWWKTHFLKSWFWTWYCQKRAAIFVAVP